MDFSSDVLSIINLKRKKKFFIKASAYFQNWSYQRSFSEKGLCADGCYGFQLEIDLVFVLNIGFPSSLVFRLVFMFLLWLVSQFLLRRAMFKGYLVFLQFDFRGLVIYCRLCISTIIKKSYGKKKNWSNVRQHLRSMMLKINKYDKGPMKCVLHSYIINLVEVTPVIVIMI